ncbi:MAG: hypothetical protein QM504_01060 [Pseudomonadota bacterium]
MKGKRTIKDKHYTFDEITRKITFVIEHQQYKLEKNVFATQGVDIDKIKVVEEYDKHKLNFHLQIHDVLVEIWRNKKPKSLQEKYFKCLMLNDFEGMKKYRDLVGRIKSLDLKVIKNNKI